MEQSDSDYLKGFTLLQSRDALGEAWELLKNAQPDDKPEFEDFGNVEIDPIGRAEQSGPEKGAAWLSRILGQEIHPNSVKLALERTEFANRAGAYKNNWQQEYEDFMNHLTEGETDIACAPSCGWGGKVHELVRSHPMEEGSCPKCREFPKRA
tara:strand:- start:9355 stop:9813 length:459 start_codon:yes stop_codon:yes gene_type:complete